MIFRLCANDNNNKVSFLSHAYHQQMYHNKKNGFIQNIRFVLYVFGGKKSHILLKHPLHRSQVSDLGNKRYQVSKNPCHVYGTTGQSQTKWFQMLHQTKLTPQITSGLKKHTQPHMV